MNSPLLRCAGIVCVCLAAVAVVLLLAPGPRVAASPAGTLEACVNPGNGMMRLVDASVSCHANETRVEWSITGPAGPPGPAGPAGPEGPAGSSAGGPPFVWVCTPAFYPQAAGSPRADVYVFNGSTMTANVSVNILDKSGTNLAGVTIPGSSPASTYPGESGSATVALSAANTRILTWVVPDDTSPGDPNVSASVRVTSDQPIVVSSDFQFSGFHAVPCSLLPK
jgi:hypothetical protein